MRIIRQVLAVTAVIGTIALVLIVILVKAEAIPAPDWPSWAVWVVGLCLVALFLLRCAGWVMTFAERKKWRTGALSDAAAAVDYLKQHETTIVREDRVDRR